MQTQSQRRLKVLIVGAALDGTDVGEVYSAFKWVEALSEIADVTVLSTERPGRMPLVEQLPLARVVTWPEPAFLSRYFERLNAIAKPAMPLFFVRVSRWLASALATGETFDIAHQIVPQAMRYGSPLRRFNIPYVIGPLGGSLETPMAFQAEMGKVPLFTRLRALDKYRLEQDPLLRESFSKASLVLGVAPYVKDVLGSIPIRRFEAVLERAWDGVDREVHRESVPGTLKLLHVGRAVRSKGLRDAVRAMAYLRDLPDVTLTSVGDGEDLETCRNEAVKLGVADRIQFLGKIPRAQVEEFYQTSDVFVFPSFREPMGGVLFEAMQWGLPIITAATGGPAFIVDEKSGFRLKVTRSEEYAREIARCVRQLAMDINLRREMSDSARARIKGLGTWHDKANELVSLYRRAVCAQQAGF